MAKKLDRCVVCGKPLKLVGWTDLYGEANCMYCGAPYQVLPIEDLKEEDLPVCNLSEEGIYWLRRYYRETGKWAPIGHYISLDDYPERAEAVKEFYRWVREKKKEEGKS